MMQTTPGELVPLLIPVIGMIGGFAVTLVLGLPLVRVLVKWFESRTLPKSEVSDTRARLERIEHAVESISLEVERIAEGQRFTTRLLADRAGERVPAGSLPADGVR